jgi:hypothetical protein
MRNGNFLSLEEPDENPNSIEFESRIPRCSNCNDPLKEDNIDLGLCDDCLKAEQEQELEEKLNNPVVKQQDILVEKLFNGGIHEKKSES